MEAIMWALKELWKQSLFANLKNYHFHYKVVCFLSYIVSKQKICIEEEKINAIKAWPKPKLVQDIQMFITFANFYRHFIQSFSKIATLLTSILKTNSHLPVALPATGINDSEVIGSSVRNDEKSTKSDFTKPMRRVEESSFLTLNARQAFTQLR